MNSILERIAACVENGKVNMKSPYPPSMRGQEGADELTAEALKEGLTPTEILDLGLIPGMNAIGLKFSENRAFVPEMLMAAKAMSTAMLHLKPYFASGDIEYKGVIVIGTVSGDLHDIGKNLVGMAMEGAGWRVIDLGVDVSAGRFISAVEENPGCVVGLSALLTTTMLNMESIVRELKERFGMLKILVGGAPLNQEFCTRIGADYYGRSSQGAIAYLNSLQDATGQ